MKNVLPLLCSAALAVLPLSSSHAALDPKIVSADARWLLHVDFNLLRQSEIGRSLLETAMKNHAPENNSTVHVDFQKVLATVGRATAYGANFAHDPQLIDGTLVVEGTADLRKIAEGYVAQAMLSTPDSITEIKDLPFEAYAVGKDVFVGFPKEQIILVSKVKAQLTRAYELYQGKGASMAKASASPLRDLVPSSPDGFLVAASVVPGDSVAPEAGPHARLMRLAQSASVNIGEKDKLTFAHVKLLADSADTADKLQKIVQGLTAMASLANTENHDLEQFMKSVTVEKQNLAVLLRLSYPSEQLSGMIKTLQQDQTRVVHNGPSAAGKMIAEWKADQDLGGNEPTENNRAVHAVENIHLAAGAILRFTGRSEGSEPARLDYVEIEPRGGGSALKFEAEYMKLSRYRAEDWSAASGGKAIVVRAGTGVAELQFPGAPGDYTLKVHYFDEADGKCTFTVRIEDPAASKE
ncbi:MAG: hypothetical protein ABIZ04_19535 [Opitutus sp.]